MKKYIFTVLLAVFALTSFAGKAQDLPFGDGEQLRYTVHYRALFNADLASLTMNCQQEGDSLHVIVDIATFKFWDSFYQMRDRYETWFLPTPDLQPGSYHRDIKEGKYWAKNWFSWSEDGKCLHAISDKRRGIRDTVITGPVVIRDVINAIYTMRAADFAAMEQGQPLDVRATLDRDIFDMTVSFVTREVMRVEGKSYNTVKLSVMLKPILMDVHDTGSEVSLQSGDKFSTIYFWITDDDNRIPVYFSTNLKVGSVRGRLVEVSGNKYPLTSLEQK